MDAAEDEDELEEEYQHFWMGPGTEAAGRTGAKATRQLPACVGLWM